MKTIMNNRNDTTHTDRQRSFAAWLGEMREFLRGRFNLEDDKAQRDEVVANISKGVEFRGVNLWVLIFATMIASLGLNVNSAAVIIGAMLISPIMGPIMGVGLSLGINDFELLKRSLRNLALMFIVAIVTSTVYFLISPLSSNSSELLARTTPTTYDVLIALFGGLAGIVAQTRQDRTSTVIPGVAIATALIPPLCTAGFGLASGQFRFFFGAFYLFFINSVFIALATYVMVRFLGYEKKVFIDKARERKVKRLMMVITLVTFIPSVVIGFHMVQVSLFEAAADKYVAQVFNFPQTRVIECNKHYAHKGSRIELLLVGEALGDEVIESARAQLDGYGLDRTELVVRQANTEDRVDVVSLQQSYQELLAEKNRRIEEMSSQLKRYRVTEDVGVNDVSREIGALMENVRAVSLTKGITFDVEGVPQDTALICVVTRRDSLRPLDETTLRNWLRLRTKVADVKIFVEP
ncbi:TIGR00341 family protein [Alistipes megaguti]|uniref:TIGR00341 family protein n=1 Tax=Alistipes megaguti TaxID=2364787 RepID=UPI002353F104|nr:TIGR00341 family protein [Alistipes megaguti]